MQQDEIVRNITKEKIEAITQQKVRNVFYLCTTKDEEIAYMVMGNNNKILGVLLFKSENDWEFIK